MLAKSQRIKKRFEFQEVFNSRKAISGANLRLHFSFNDSPAQPKLALITSKKLGKAHERNKLRRRLSEIFMHHKLSKLNGFKLIVNSKNEAAKLDYSQLTTEFTQLLDRIRY